MKKVFLLSLVTIISIITYSQTAKSQEANYAAAGWKTMLIDNPQKIHIATAPTLKQSKEELLIIKKRMSLSDPKKNEQVRYWNAGAPSYRWNQVIPPVASQKFDVSLRTPAAWMNIAIYDATVIAWREKLKYKRKAPHLLDPTIQPGIVNASSLSTYSYPCEHSATAAAAAHVLAYFFPEKADSFLQLAHAASQSRIDAGVRFPSDVEAGWALGKQIAEEIIEKAKKDGSANKWDGQMNKDSKMWTGKNPVGIMLRTFTPITLKSADQFRPLPPPSFEKDMAELKNFKATFKSKSLAYFWANTGPEYYNDLAGQKMFEYGINNDAPAAARIYAVLHTSYHDATIAIMDAKYAYWGIRPFQYDSTYTPLISTPPFPGYPSGHAAGAATTCAVLEYFFPADTALFRQIEKDCAESRFYAGIHFRTDNEVGLKMGKELGNYIVQSWINK